MTEEEERTEGRIVKIYIMTHFERKVHKGLNSHLAPFFHSRLIRIRTVPTATWQVDKLQQAEVLGRYEARFDCYFELFLQVRVEVANCCGSGDLRLVRVVICST